MESGLKLGIVYIGKAGGKHKYCLIDEKDIPLVKRFRFEAKVDIDRDGNGARIYAYAFDITKDKSGCYFHDYIWERHCGGIAPGFKVFHKNGVTVDNRLCNLFVMPYDSKFRGCQHQKSGCGANEPSDDQNLYWTAVSRLPAFEAQDEHYINANFNKFYNANGELIKEEDDSSSFYECHFAPCTRMESELQEFSICGRCQQVRYCGILCQQRDWPSHKKYCKERARQRFLESPPDR
ncbi:zinc finger MYND domain-containing protein 19 [Nematostella vectensis]|uniref:zinc finger MYND domain-containing protein 19 n=1 Tax=Nematostella vectensis TaxID=45351 RepID=UPI0013902593|nr:zinc finger MYND domain-containing protein 19 [Nematostella vectensis]